MAFVKKNLDKKEQGAPKSTGGIKDLNMGGGDIIQSGGNDPQSQIKALSAAGDSMAANNYAVPGDSLNVENKLLPEGDTILPKPAQTLEPKATTGPAIQPEGPKPVPVQPLDPAKQRSVEDFMELMKNPDGSWKPSETKEQYQENILREREANPDLYDEFVAMQGERPRSTRSRNPMQTTDIKPNERWQAEYMQFLRSKGATSELGRLPIGTRTETKTGPSSDDLFGIS